MGSGLVDKKKAKSIQKEKRNKRKQAGKGQEDQDKLEQQRRVEEQRRIKQAKDKELNLIKKQVLEQKAILAQVKQLIETNKIERQTGEIGFQFADNKKIKKIFVNEEQHRHLSNGLLAIVKLDEEYILIPCTVAQKIAQRDMTSLVYLSTKTGVDEDEEHNDDPYKDYVIPDDLMW